jgi:hypothetical protein
MITTAGTTTITSMVTLLELWDFTSFGKEGWCEAPG